MKSVYDLEFKLLKTSSSESTSDLEECYRLWQPAWKETFSELHVERELFSDDFLDRELGGVFFEGKPVGFLLWRVFDLSRESSLAHSYFKGYPSHLKSEISSWGPTMIISYMTIHPEWRKSHTDLPVSELLISFAVKRFKQMNVKNLLGYFRNERKTNDMFYRHGGETLIKNAGAYNVEVDYAFISQTGAHDSTLDGVAEAASYLWDQSQLKKLKVA